MCMYARTTNSITRTSSSGSALNTYASVLVSGADSNDGCMDASLSGGSASCCCARTRAEMGDKTAVVRRSWSIPILDGATCGDHPYYSPSSDCRMSTMITGIQSQLQLNLSSVSIVFLTSTSLSVNTESRI
jgi:hypothetical protein